jgi:hypothetical protein
MLDVLVNIMDLDDDAALRQIISSGPQLERHRRELIVALIKGNKINTFMYIQSEYPNALLLRSDDRTFYRKGTCACTPGRVDRETLRCTCDNNLFALQTCLDYNNVEMLHLFIETLRPSREACTRDLKQVLSFILTKGSEALFRAFVDRFPSVRVSCEDHYFTVLRGDVVATGLLEVLEQSARLVQNGSLTKHRLYVAAIQAGSVDAMRYLDEAFFPAVIMSSDRSDIFGAVYSHGTFAVITYFEGRHHHHEHRPTSRKLALMIMTTQEGVLRAFLNAHRGTLEGELTPACIDGLLVTASAFPSLPQPNFITFCQFFHSTVFSTLTPLILFDTILHYAGGGNDTVLQYMLSEHANLVHECLRE